MLQLLNTILQTPTKKPLTKREKDAAKEFDIGKVNVKAWRQSCLESEDKKRNTITKATINRVSFAIISLFSQKLYALAFSSEMPMSDRGWVQSKKGAKPKQSGEVCLLKKGDDVHSTDLVHRHLILKHSVIISCVIITWHGRP